ncbi:PREDICTED: uncharacterized protein LOC107342772 isoform X3 [Acropora digitifera]|uniref:uncharacterized protein LOC107342772 isoform X3 n=1 Tax=Acropora digitifera TaxID=70779 RepID=UPI00077AD258|nr:PREDICTED: uncharacterized protein LOC107342772 isoform X3 [Acropora digitifera]
MAFRRSFSSSYNCDQSIINSGALRGSGGSWIARYRCSSGYCSFGTIANTGFQCTDFSVDEDWTMGENNFTYTFSSVSKEWIVSYQGCCWISSLVKYPDGNWLVSTTVNLTRRADTGRINSSPVSKSPAIIRFEEGCPQSFRIPVEDPDDDVVKCRWATYSESSRQADSFPHGVIDERACLLQYNGRNRTAGTYAVALTLEDFPEGTTDFSSITRFSAVGLQFLVIVTARSGSCTDVPLFTKSTPSDGECTEVQIGSAYRAVIEVKLQDLLRHVTEIVTSSPVGMQLTPLRQDALLGIFYRNITWYPSQYQVGQQLFCFKAKDSAGSESEWRCITILVGLSNTPRVVLGTQWPRYPSSQFGTGFMWLSIQFDRVIKKPRTSAYVRLVLRPSEHTVYKVDTLSRNVVISANKTALLFALPKAALSMRGSYAILIDRGAVVGLGCSFDGPPTPGMSSPKDWGFNVYGICSTGYSLDPPYYRSCVDVNECGNPSRKKRYAWWGPVTSTSSSPTPTFSTVATSSPGAEFSHVSTSTPGVYASASPPSLSGLALECFNHSYLEDSVRGQGFYNGYYGYYQCDNYLPFGWYRFRGAAGTQMPTKCVAKNRCSSHAPGWLNASHPSVEDGIVTAKVCFHWSSGCCTWSTYIRVRNCSGFYVYELRPPPTCWLRYCGNGGSNQSITTSSPQTSPTPGSCVYNLTNPQGNFTSPNHPSPHQHYLNCFWTITAAPGDYIHLYFLYFHLEYGSSYCPYDYVEVTDPNYPTSSIKIKRCGYQSPWCVTSTSNVMYVRFVTDLSVAYSGFFASYTNHPNPFSGNCASLNATQIQTTQGSYPTPTSTPGVSVSTSPPFPSGSCGYNFKDRQGNLTSPNYPFSYPNSLNCLWTITATPGDYIYLYFTYFYVQGYNYYWWYGRYGNYGYNNYCPYDYVEVFDLNYPSSFIKVRGCGYQSPWCVKTKSQVMHIRFVTNSIYSFTGFTANYTVYRTPPLGDNCLSLNPYASSSTILHATPTFSTVATSSLGAEFSHVSTSTPGVSASVSPPFPSGSCGYNFTDRQGNLSSPNYPFSYPSNLNCLWTITATPGDYIYLYFTSFYVQGYYSWWYWGYNAHYYYGQYGRYGYNSYCPYDYVDIFDLNYPSSFIKVRGCGQQSPWCVKSKSHVMHIRFVTNSIYSYRGFTANYTVYRTPPVGDNCLSLNPYASSSTIFSATPTFSQVSTSTPGSCVYNLTNPQGNFTSPNHPSPHQHYLNCFWTITAAPGYYIHLYFLYFHLEYGSSYCPYDYVEVTDPNYPTSSIKIKRCGYQIPWCVTSTSNVLYVRFVTDGSVAYSGFFASYTNHPNPFSGNCTSLNATQIQTTQGSSPIAMPISALHPTSSSITGVPASASLPFPSVGIIYPTPASKRLPHYSSTVTQEKVPDFYLQLPADCEQVCQNTAGSYICSCVSGYQLASDGKSCSDINECSVNNGGCSHHCYNIPGAHYCGCPEGTTMAANNLTCVQPGVTVTCGERNMTISLEKQSLSFVRAEEVHLRYSSCKATENGTHVTISTLLNDCGTSVNETQDALLFWNELRVDAVIIDDVITRSHDIRLPFYCSYSRKKLLSLSFNSLGVYYGQEEGYGNFTFKMDFFKSGSFLTPYRTADYPLQLRLNDYIYVRYSVQSSADLVIMAENCRATKDGSFYSLPQYKIIQNGCGRDTTMVYSYNSNRPYQEFRMKVFRFYNDYNAVYLHCELLACHRSSRNSRCQRGCMPGNRRKRRAVSRDGTEHMESTTKNIVSRGPLIFKDEVKQGDTGQGKVGAWIGGVAGAGGVCILAFAALGILLVKYRSARRLMNRNKVGDLFATQEEMGRKSANVKEDNMNTKEDSL